MKHNWEKMYDFRHLSRSLEHAASKNLWSYAKKGDINSVLLTIETHQDSLELDGEYGLIECHIVALCHGYTDIAALIESEITSKKT